MQQYSVLQDHNRNLLDPHRYYVTSTWGSWHLFDSYIIKTSYERHECNFEGVLNQNMPDPGSSISLALTLFPVAIFVAKARIVKTCKTSLRRIKDSRCIHGEPIESSEP